MPTVPQVLPSVQPTSSGSGGFFNIQDPTMAFGYGVGQAERQLGQTIERTGDMLEKHANFLQDRANQAAATDLFVNWDKDASALQTWHRQQEGANAVNTLPELYRKQDELRQKYIDQTPNIEVRRMFDNDSKRRLGYMIQDAGLYSANQNKAANIRASKARQTLAIEHAGNSQSDDEFQSNVDSALKGVEAEAVERGWDQATITVEKEKAKSATWQSRLQTIAMTDPFRAEKLYNANKEQILDPHTRRQIEQNLIIQGRNVGTRYDENSIVNGLPPKDLPTLPGSYRSGIATAETGHIKGEQAKYEAEGPLVDSGRFAGQHAIGKYQIMEQNVRDWTKEVLGKEMSPDEFKKDPEAQDKVFDAKFGELVKKYGNPQDAASAWFSGRPLAQAVAEGATDKYTKVQDYVNKFNRGLGGGQGPLTPDSDASWLASAIGQAKVVAAARYPGNEALAKTYEDTLVTRIKSNYANVHTMKNAVDTENFMNVQQALIEQKDGKPVITNVSQLLDNPALNASYNALNPVKQKQVLSQIERNAKADVPLTQERFDRFQQLKGLAVTDPKAFMDVAVGDQDLPRTLQGQLLTQQRSMQKNLQDTSRLTRAISTVTPMLNDAGIVRSRTDQAKASQYNQFVGAYQTELEAWEKENQKFPNEKEQMQIASKLLRETVPAGWFSSAQRGFEVPDANRTEITAAFQKRYGRPPTPAETYTVFQRQQQRETGAQRYTEGLTLSQAAAQIQQITNKAKINPANWDRMVAGSPDASNIDDRRSPDDIKYEDLYDKFQRDQPLSPSELSWLNSYHILHQLEHQRRIDDYNESRGFKVNRPRVPRPQE